MKKRIFIIVAILLVLVVGFIFIIKPVLDKAKEKKEDKKKLDRTEIAKKFAKQIYDAKGFWNDDEDAIYSALSGKSIYQINTIDKMFQNKYGQDLEDFFKEILSEEERKKVNTIINSAKRKAQ